MRELFLGVDETHTADEPGSSFFERAQQPEAMALDLNQVNLLAPHVQLSLLSNEVAA